MVMPANKYYYTPEEYLALEKTAEYKSEYYKGEMFAMADSTVNHDRICRNLIQDVGQALENKPCEVFTSNMRVLVRPIDFYTYPDVSVICGQPELAQGRRDIIVNPVVIIEVLSDSTKNYDAKQKFSLYRGITTLQDYILIDQSQVQLHYYHKIDARHWLLEVSEDLDDILKLPSIGVEIALNRIYNKVNFT